MGLGSDYLNCFGIAQYQTIAFHEAIHSGDVVTILHGKSTYARVGHTTNKIALGYEGVVTLNPIPCGFTAGNVDVSCSYGEDLVDLVYRSGLSGIQRFLRELQVLIG